MAIDESKRFGEKGALVVMILLHYYNAYAPTFERVTHIVDGVNPNRRRGINE